MTLLGETFGLVGALAAFPARLAAREVEARGGALRRGTGRGVTRLVLGRRLLARPLPEIDARLAATEGRPRLSESGLLRLLGLLPASPPEGLPRQALLDQSGLDATGLDRLALFDAFERDTAPFSFRDLILARKYAGLLAGGAGWAAIARSVHRVGPVASLTAKALHVAPCGGIYASSGDGLAELDGQGLLDLGLPADPDETFADAEAAEAEGEFDRAARLYGRCLAADPRDAVAAFNRANCLRALGQADAAADAYLQAIRRDPHLVEAWFNLAALLTGTGRKTAARRHLARAIALDPDYADAVYNLATLDFEAGDHAAARAGWERYLALDATSEWARTAARGLHFLALQDRAG